MIYDMALVAVAVGAGYWGQFFLRNRPHGTPTFGIMLLGAALLCLAGMYGRHGGGDGLSLAGAIGFGTGTILLVVGPFVTGVARRLAKADRIGAAMKLFEIADMIAPGAGARDEKAMLRAMLDIRAGKIDPTIAALANAKSHAPPQTHAAIDERIAMLYLAAHRWREGIAHAEQHLVLDGTGPIGIAEPVWVELVGAYGREGDIARAGRMAARLEDSLANEPRGAIWRHRGRLAFLALAGRPAAVTPLVAKAASPHMSPAARSYWLAVAHDRAGEHGIARGLYEKAKAQGKGRGKDLVGDALDKLPATDGTPIVLDDETAAIADRLAAAPLPVLPRMPGSVRTMPFVVGVLIGVYLFVNFAVGEPGDLGVLARTGAALHGLVAQGEWWRLGSSVFLHTSVWQLVLDVVGVWILGRLAEVVFGGWRALAIFGLAAVAGTTAAYFATSTGVPIGVGGAVFGLLGAVFVELTTNRARYQRLAGKGLWTALAVIIVVQLGWDLVSNVGGPWQNGGGLVAGVLAGLVLSPHRAPAVGLWLARAVTIGFAGLAVASGFLVARTPLATSLSRTESKLVTLGPQIGASVPADWWVGTLRAEQPDSLAELTVAVLDEDPAKWLVAQQNGLRAETTSTPGDQPPDDLAWEQHAAAPLLAAPAGWTTQELTFSFDEPGGAHQTLRVVFAWRRIGTVTVGARLLAPELVVRDAGPVLAALLASIVVR